MGEAKLDPPLTKHEARFLQRLRGLRAGHRYTMTVTIDAQRRPRDWVVSPGMKVENLRKEDDEGEMVVLDE